MAEAVEEATSWRSTSGKVIISGGIDSTLPEGFVLLRQEPVIYPAELAAGVPGVCRLDTVSSVCWILRITGCFWVQNPATCLALELIALRDRAVGCVFWRKEEEDVAVSDCEIKDDVSILILVAARCMTVES